MDGRLLILEGPDGAGKTTLADEFRRQGFTYVHQGPFRENAVLETMDNVLNAMKVASPPVVLYDRLHLGERVYGPIFRNKDLLGEIGQRNVERWLADRFHAMVVLCLPPRDVALQNWKDRVVTSKEMFTDERKMGLVWDEYNVLRTSLPMVRYDYTKHTPASLADRLGELYHIAYGGKG